MECFKAEVTSLASNASSSTTKPNKESMEYAIVALIRTFSAEANTFRAYLQAGKDSRVATGIAGLGTLSQQASAVVVASQGPGWTLLAPLLCGGWLGLARACVMLMYVCHGVLFCGWQQTTLEHFLLAVGCYLR